MEKKIVIAVDGYSSCGKSTMAKDLAKEIGYTYIDSGAMYRAVTLYCLQNEIIENVLGDKKNRVLTYKKWKKKERKKMSDTHTDEVCSRKAILLKVSTPNAVDFSLVEYSASACVCVLRIELCVDRRFPARPTIV